MRLVPHNAARRAKIACSESWPELQIRMTQLVREGYPPPGVPYLRPSYHALPIN